MKKALSYRRIFNAEENRWYFEACTEEDGTYDIMTFLTEEAAIEYLLDPVKQLLLDGMEVIVDL